MHDEDIRRRDLTTGHEDEIMERSVLTILDSGEGNETASKIKPNHGQMQAQLEAGATGLEPATSGVTGRRSNQLSYAPEGWAAGALMGLSQGRAIRVAGRSA
jgi:hypothetical protein